MMYVITACTPTTEVFATTCSTMAGFVAYVKSTQPGDVVFLDNEDEFCGWKIYETPGPLHPPSRIAFACWDGTHDISPFYTPNELENKLCRSS